MMGDPNAQARDVPSFQAVLPKFSARGEHSRRAALPPLPESGGNFLIYEPVRAVLLYKGGIPVTVPTPERYALHKLIIVPERQANPLKANKDIAQAEQIIATMLPRRSYALQEAWAEANE